MLWTRWYAPLHTHILFCYNVIKKVVDILPILKFKAIDLKDVCTISKPLIDALQELLQCPREYFNLEVIRSDYVSNGEIVPGSPIVEVYWFDRGQEVQDQAARIIRKYIHSMAYSDVDVIYFSLDENKYYENGQHF